jgi:hypothetical protein
LQLSKYVSKEARLKVEIYHGPGQHDMLEKICDNKIDVLLTSFDTLASDYKKLELSMESEEKEVEEPNKEEAEIPTAKRVAVAATPTPCKARNNRIKYSENMCDSDDDAASVAEQGSDSEDDSLTAYDEDEYNLDDSAYFDVEEADCSAWADEEELETIFDVGFHRVVVSYLGGAIQSITHDSCILFSPGLFPLFHSWMRHT